MGDDFARVLCNYGWSGKDVCVSVFAGLARANRSLLFGNPVKFS
jgi:hypothetical protein